jgi:hypothetical protein
MTDETQHIPPEWARWNDLSKVIERAAWEIVSALPDVWQFSAHQAEASRPYTRVEYRQRGGGGRLIFIDVRIAESDWDTLAEVRRALELSDTE